MDAKPRITIVGSRGIPAAYGGYESQTEQLATRLCAAGFAITVTCEPRGLTEPNSFKGVRLSYFPLRPPKPYSMRILYEILGDVGFLLREAPRCDTIYLLGVAAAPFLGVVRLLRPQLNLLLNVDGAEWERTKFNILGRALLKCCFVAGTWFSHRIVLDSNAMAKFLAYKRRAKAAYCPNGVTAPLLEPWSNGLVGTYLSRRSGTEDTQATRILPGEYWLVVARLEPENNAHMIVDGFIRSGSLRRLLVIGDFTSERYRTEIEGMALRDERRRVILAGSLYDQHLLASLRQHAFGYIHGHSVGGTNPSLLEAMASKNVILAHDNPYNREVCSDGAYYFGDPSALTAAIERAERDSEEERDSLRNRCFERAIEEYSWSKVISVFSALAVPSQALLANGPPPPQMPQR